MKRPASDALILRKLAVARQIYLQATRQRDKPTAVDRLIGVVEYDLAVEMVLKSGLAALEPRKTPKDNFPELVQQVRDALGKTFSTDLPPSRPVQLVRNIRNAAQHEGRLPSVQEAEECHVVARVFLDDFVRLVWEIGWDEISLAELIGDEVSRARIREGEQALSDGRLQEAVEKATEALEWALARVKNALVGRGDSWARAILVEDTFGKPKSSRELTDSIRRTQETVLYLALGLDYGDLVRFRGIGGQVIFTMVGSASHHGTKADLADADAQFCLGYATEALVQIESRVGSIGAPFGRDRWY